MNPFDLRFRASSMDLEDFWTLLSVRGVRGFCDAVIITRVGELFATFFPLAQPVSKQKLSASNFSFVSTSEFLKSLVRLEEYLLHESEKIVALMEEDLVVAFFHGRGYRETVAAVEKLCVALGDPAKHEELRQVAVRIKGGELNTFSSLAELLSALGL